VSLARVPSAAPMSTAQKQELDAFWSGSAPEERQRYRDVKLVGSGAYSVVARAMDAKTGEPVAIKRIAEVFYDAQEAKKVLREIRLLRDFSHPNVISLRALASPKSMETFDDIFMITDYMETDLRKIIKSKQQLVEKRVRSYMAQILAGLQHVHTISGIHRDLKPANLLVSPNHIDEKTPFGLLRLCDFGLARVDSNRAAQREENAAQQMDTEFGDDGPSGDASPPPLKASMTSYVVTRWYRAPEVILRQSYTAAIDVWAVGCIFKELLELTPSSKYRTGALFPGRYCIPFSFDDDQRERQRHDQLAVITRILGEPTAQEMAWADDGAKDEILAVCFNETLQTMSTEERQQQVEAKLRDTVPVANPLEVTLLRALLEFEPKARPSAKAALTYDYFAELPEAERPPMTDLDSDDKRRDAVKDSFAFEQETLGTNELRILLANDLFRMKIENDESDAKGAGASSAAAAK